MEIVVFLNAVCEHACNFAWTRSSDKSALLFLPKSLYTLVCSTSSCCLILPPHCLIFAINAFQTTCLYATVTPTSQPFHHVLLPCPACSRCIFQLFRPKKNGCSSCCNNHRAGTFRSTTCDVSMISYAFKKTLPKFLVVSKKKNLISYC